MSEPRKHVDRGCWCKPKVMQTCPVCIGDFHRKDCSECGGTGLVMAFSGANLIVIHNEEARRDEG